MPTTTCTSWGTDLFEAMVVQLARPIRDDATTRISDGDVGVGAGLDRLRIALALLRSRGDVADLLGEPHSNTAIHSNATYAQD